jgi:hypothetical protein
LIIVDIVQIEASWEEGIDIDVIEPDQVLYAPAQTDLRRDRAVSLEVVNNLVRLRVRWQLTVFTLSIQIELIGRRVRVFDPSSLDQRVFQVNVYFRANEHFRFWLPRSGLAPVPWGSRDFWLGGFVLVDLCGFHRNGLIAFDEKFNTILALFLLFFRLFRLFGLYL